MVEVFIFVKNVQIWIAQKEELPKFVIWKKTEKIERGFKCQTKLR